MATPNDNVVSALLRQVRTVHPLLDGDKAKERAAKLALAYEIVDGRLMPSENLARVAAARQIDPRVVQRIAQNLFPPDPNLSDAQKGARAEQQARALGFSFADGIDSADDATGVDLGAIMRDDDPEAA